MDVLSSLLSVRWSLSTAILFTMYQGCRSDRCFSCIYMDHLDDISEEHVNKMKENFSQVSDLIGTLTRNAHLGKLTLDKACRDPSTTPGSVHLMVNCNTKTCLKISHRDDGRDVIIRMCSPSNECAESSQWMCCHGDMCNGGATLRILPLPKMLAIVAVISMISKIL